MKRVLTYLCVLIVAVLLGEALRERAAVHKVDLRSFDASAVGRLDTDMWRSYYERRPVLLLRQMVTLLGTQYHMPPFRAVVNAYRAAHAAFMFKDGKSRAGYEKALPDLEAYYGDIAAQATSPFDSHEAARLELEWWILHRERSPELAASLAALQAEIYRLPAAAFAEHARLRAEAMILRDDRGEHITEEDWRQIGGMLDRSWASLHTAVNESNRTSTRLP
jgi:hypothetical protein